MLTFAGGQKGFDANVKADSRKVASQTSLARQQTSAYHLPASVETVTVRRHPAKDGAD